MPTTRILIMLNKEYRSTGFDGQYERRIGLSWSPWLRANRFGLSKISYLSILLSFFCMGCRVSEVKWPIQGSMRRLFFIVSDSPVQTDITSPSVQKPYTFDRSRSAWSWIDWFSFPGVSVLGRPRKHRPVQKNFSQKSSLYSAGTPLFWARILKQ